MTTQTTSSSCDSNGPTSRPTWYTKDPDAVLDYQTDWSDWLTADETITTSVWLIALLDGYTEPDGSTTLTEDSTTSTGTTATIWLSAGAVGASYAVTSRVTTSQGRTDDRTFYVDIQQR